VFQTREAVCPRGARFSFAFLDFYTKCEDPKITTNRMKNENTD
jgi:hypothetical protein